MRLPRNKSRVNEQVTGVPTQLRLHRGDVGRQCTHGIRPRRLLRDNGRGIGRNPAIVRRRPGRPRVAITLVVVVGIEPQVTGRHPQRRRRRLTVGFHLGIRHG